MRRTHFLMVLALGAGIAVAASAGCELIASVDRTLIPVETGAGGGTGGSGGGVTTGGGQGGTGGTGGSMLVDGTPCSAATQCNSGSCVDGVCCDTACDAECDSCTGALKEGGGDDGVCGNSAMGGACGDAAGCTNATLNNADSCDGNGTCNDGGSMTCPSGYQCNAAGTACETMCVDDSDCVDTHYCDAGSCVPDNGTGSACQNANQCTSGFCEDGVCCGDGCTGTCMACNVAGSMGTCTDIPPGGTEQGCSGMSACNGSGMCLDGNGQPCTAGTTCATGHCVDTVCCETTCTAACKTCNGTMPGTCGNEPQGTVDTACSAPNTTCNNMGQCRLPENASCGSDNECASGSCPGAPTGFCTAP